MTAGKRLLSLMMAVLVTVASLALLAAFPAGAAGITQVTVGSVEGKIGDTVTVPVSVSASSNAAAGDFILNYDPEMLEYVSYTSGDEFNVSYKLGNLSKEGIFLFAFASLEPCNNACTMFSVTFKIKSNAVNELNVLLTVHTFVEDSDTTSFPKIVTNVKQGVITVTNSTASGIDNAAVTDRSGNKVVNGSATGAQTDNQPLESQSAGASTIGNGPGGNNNLTIIFIIVLIVIAVASIAAVILFTNKKAGNKNDTPPDGNTVTPIQDTDDTLAAEEADSPLTVQEADGSSTEQDIEPPSATEEVDLSFAEQESDIPEQPQPPSEDNELLS